MSLECSFSPTLHVGLAVCMSSFQLSCLFDLFLFVCVCDFLCYQYISSTVDEICWQHCRVAVAKVSKSKVWNKVPEGSRPILILIFRVTRISFITQWRIGWRKPPCQKISWIHLTVSIELRLVKCDRQTQTDRRRYKPITSTALA